MPRGGGGTEGTTDRSAAPGTRQRPTRAGLEADPEAPLPGIFICPCLFLNDGATFRLKASWFQVQYHLPQYRCQEHMLQDRPLLGQVCGRRGPTTLSEAARASPPKAQTPSRGWASFPGLPTCEPGRCQPTPPRRSPQTALRPATDERCHVAEGAPSQRWGVGQAAPTPGPHAGRLSSVAAERGAPRLR